MRPAINFLTYKGTSSRDFATFISGGGTFDAPEREIERFEVPGRSGDLIIDNHKFKNITVKYSAFINRDFEQNFAALRSFLLSDYGYFRLEDTYHPDEYRMAAFAGPIEANMFMAKYGSFDLEFDCMPQRWLKSGENSIQLGESELIKIWNPTRFTAKPLIIVASTGTFYVNGTQVQVTTNNGNLVIDSDLEECYEGTTNRNADVSFSNYSFPELTPGENTIQTGAGMYIQLTPRWWTV